MPSLSIVAACQFAPKLFEVDNNVAVAQQMTFEAFAKGARVVVLPECCTSGYSFQNEQEAAKCAQSRDGWQTQSFVQLCKSFNSHVVFGYVELHEGKLYNSAAIVGPKGLEGNSQKHNRFGSDALWATPSEAMFPIVLSAAGRLGCVICKDVRNNYRDSYVHYDPDHKFYRKGDVDTIALPVNWAQNFSFPGDAWLDLQESTAANVIVANRFGKERDTKFKGGSCVISRDGTVYTNGNEFDAPCIVGGVATV